MSFGGFGNNNNSGGFSGFGSSTNNNTNTTSSGSIFGSNTATSGGFGGFGGNNASTNPFGAPKTGFGSGASTGGGGLFGSNNATSGGFGSGGFGNNASNATPGATLSTGFGGGANTSSLFGGNKSTTGAFGTTNTGGGSIFGGSGNNTGNAFGSNTTSSFGTNNNNASNPFGSNTFNNNNNNATSFGNFGGNNAAAATTQGTASTPFQAFTEKDGGAAGGTSAYQSITMQQPYQSKSFDELRLEDYAQNRRLPQSGSFGASTSFGGFGNNMTANNTFGSSNTGFSNNNATTGSNLFGAKTNTGGLFGNNAASSSTTGGFGSAPSNNTTSLFGSGNNASSTGGFGSGGFGTNTNNTSNTGLFGAANNNNKSTFGGFGGTNTTATSNSLGGFGSNTGNNSTQPTSNLFGGATGSGGFGSNTTNNLFGSANANKPASTGLFGSTNTNTGNTGLFGNTSNQTNTNAFGGAAAGNSLFGQGNSNNNTSLFGGNNNANKPTTGLFGAANTGNASNTGLFGASNNAAPSLFGGNQPAAGNSSLFGGNNNKPAPSLFGSTNTNNQSLFGGNNTQPANNSLFGGSQPAGNSLFGGSQGQPQQNQLTASLTSDPYGNAQLFASLASPSPPVGPLATPLNGAKPVNKARASLLASVRGNSPMLGGSVSATPRGRSSYGMSYSSYNSPTSTPVLTPGATSLLRPTGSLGSALSSRLSKSFSTSNLRGDTGEGQSLVRTPVPGQSSLLLGSGSLGSGNVRRLKIDRSVRTDLFGSASKKPAEPAKDAEKEKEHDLRKRVSFDKSAEKDAVTTTATPTASNALVVREEDEGTQTPEMSQINGGSTLTTVQEEASADKAGSTQTTPKGKDQGGEYYTEPSMKHVKAMSRSQLSNIKNFTVGRQGVGKIEFGRNAAVDLNNVPLDDICGKIVQLKPRSATVYENDADKPAVGRGLNVPSTIHLEQSWPRSARVSSTTPKKSTQKEIDRHITRLKRVTDTTFVSYNDVTGVWVFTVEHFTTYEFDDDEETTMHDTTEISNNAAQGQEQPSFADSTDSERIVPDSPDFGEQDDTFQFKLTKRSNQDGFSLPGGFEDSMPTINHDYDEASADEMQEDELVMSGGLGEELMSDPFLETAGAVRAPSPDTLERYRSSQMEVGPIEIVEKQIPGSFQAEEGLKSILKPSAAQHNVSEDLAGLPWEEQLQRTLSPKKRDRQALRDIQSTTTQKDVKSDSLLRRSLLTRSQLGQTGKMKPAQNETSTTDSQSQAFKTSMDIMKSLWAGQRSEKRANAFGEARQPTYRKQHSDLDVDPREHLLHNFFKPTFSPDGRLVIRKHDDEHRYTIQSVDYQPGEGRITEPLRDVQQIPEYTRIQLPEMEIDSDLPTMPEAETWPEMPFDKLATSIHGKTAHAKHEKNVWRLCSVLFDPLELCASRFTNGMTDLDVSEHEKAIREDAFMHLWREMLAEDISEQLKHAKTAEHKALIWLTVGNIAAAADVLSDAGNRRLAILISQLPVTESTRETMAKQIKVWCERHDWSEFSDGQRALYSLLAGQTCLVSGVKGAKEDKVNEFVISKRFGLKWQQSIALKLQFGGAENTSDAVLAYASDVDEFHDEIKPEPWHGKAKSSEDTLLSVLKIMSGNVNSGILFDPLTTSGDVFDSRLAWQLATVLRAKGLAHLDDDRLDVLTLDLASEQAYAGEIEDSVWTLLHVTDNDSRYAAVKSCLELHGAALVSAAPGEAFFDKLTESWHVPASLFWLAKASYAKGGQKDSLLQAQYLLQAATTDSINEAHGVLYREIGPTAVIEQHYDGLGEILNGFADIDNASIEGWSSEGQIYADMCDFAMRTKADQQGRHGEVLLKKLDKALVASKNAGQHNFTLEMRVAFLEMRKMVDDGIKRLENADRWAGTVDRGSAVQTKGNEMLEKYMLALGTVN